MPFDALLAPSEPKTLAQALADRRILPVGWAGLAAHKEAQLAKYQPSFWHRHEAWLPIALVGSVGCMAASGGLTHALMAGASLLAWTPTLIWLGAFALLITFGVFRVRGAAYWLEQNISVGELGRHGVPAAIAITARALSRDLPGSELIIGELIEEAVVLDPYLIVVHNDEMACLGIWDDDHVIACADFDPGPAARRSWLSTLDHQPPDDASW
jgi:hypothetical protein